MVSVKTKSELIADIGLLVTAVGDKFEPDEDGDAEREFMIDLCPPRLHEPLRSLSTLSMHLLAAIAEAPVSVVGLAARAGQLKGTVSKHVQRLVDAGLVARTPVPGNRKEIELSLSDDGELVAEAHRRLHDEMAAGHADFLRRYDKADLAVIARVLGDLMAADKIGVRLRWPGD
jgi:DNA-binding MarR family transcriptional regulator